MTRKPYDIVLVGCTQTKAAYPSTAETLYRSPLFKASRLWAITNGKRWAILSARHGIVWPEQVLEPYDETWARTGRNVHAVRAWGFRVQAELCHLAKEGKPARCAVLAGFTYTRPLRNVGAIRGFDEPLAGLSIGHRLRWLNENTNRPGRRPVPAQPLLPIF